jgi:hypothetical protein
MKRKIIKRILLGLLIIIVFIFLIMITPRVWSVINPGKPPVGYHFVVADYLAVWTGLEKLINKTPVVPEDIKEIKDIEYKNIGGKSLQLDMYIPKNVTKPAPLLVFIHGGGWRGGNRADYLVYLVDFAQKGYITATVSYRLLKDAPFLPVQKMSQMQYHGFSKTDNNMVMILTGLLLSAVQQADTLHCWLPMDGKMLQLLPIAA